MAGRNGVGALGTTLLTPVDVIAALLDSYRQAIKDADPAGAFVNNQAGVFTFVHCAATTKQAIENGAAEAAAWYANTIVKFFELEQALLRRTEGSQPEPADCAGAGLVGDIQAPQGAAAPAPTVDHAAAMALIQRLAHGEQISGEEVYEVLNKQDSVIIGDPETCRKKMERYRQAGVDRLLCFQQVGGLSHEVILESTRLVGEHLIPHFSPK